MKWTTVELLNWMSKNDSYMSLTIIHVKYHILEQKLFSEKYLVIPAFFKFNDVLKSISANEEQWKTFL